MQWRSAQLFLFQPADRTNTDSTGEDERRLVNSSARNETRKREAVLIMDDDGSTPISSHSAFCPCAHRHASFRASGATCRPLLLIPIALAPLCPCHTCLSHSSSDKTPRHETPTPYKWLLARRNTRRVEESGDRSFGAVRSSRGTYLS